MSTSSNISMNNPQWNFGKGPGRLPFVGSIRPWVELSVAAVLAGLGTFLAINIATMEVVGDDSPGPRFFPTIIMALLYASAIGIAIRVVLAARARRASDVLEEEQPRTDWLTLGAVFASFVVFIVILEPVGWLISATGLYWSICTAMGAKGRLKTLGIALLVASFIQIAFGMGLGLTLPSGLIGAIF